MSIRRQRRAGAIRFGVGDGANGWTAPSSSATFGSRSNESTNWAQGAGLGTFLGWYDTRPHEPPPDEEGHRAVNPVPLEGGRATLRVRLANPVVVDVGGLLIRNMMADGAAHFACPLFVAGFNGPLPDSLAPSLTDGWSAPTLVNGPALACYINDPNPRLDADVNFNAAINATLRPVLDVLPYAQGATAWASFDLSALAGGCRYVAAFLRPITMLVGTADGLDDSQARLLWEVDDRPAEPLRDWRWTMPVKMTPLLSASGVFAIAPPFPLLALYGAFASPGTVGAVCRLTESFGGSSGRTVDLTTTSTSDTVVGKVADVVAWPIRVQCISGGGSPVGMLHLWGTAA